MNLAGLQAAVQAKGYTVDTATQQVLFLNEVYREVHGEARWPFLEAQDSSLVTAAGVNAYTLPMASWRNLDAVRIQIAANQQYDNLEYLQPQDFRELEHIDRDVTTPFYWTFYANQLHFYPYPDSVYTVVIDYIVEPPDLAAPGDVPVLPLPYHDILVWGACESLAYRERDWLGREFAQQKKEALLKRMTEEYLVRQRQTSSHVKKSGYWQSQTPFPFSQNGF
jgi:hypothetical protein